MSEKLIFPPVSYVGWGTLNKLLDEVNNFNVKKILIVTDPVLKDLGITKQVSDPLDQAGYQVHVYAEVMPEPPLSLGQKLVNYTRKNDFDLVIGIGGGSALDLAKLASVLAVHDGDVIDYLDLNGTKNIVKKGIPKILIPTTSGTGSEVTNITVLTLDTTKDVVTHDYLLADIAIVDPALTVSLPPRVTAATGVDALTHAIEAYLSVNANPVSDALALQAVGLISKSIRTAVEDGQDKQARTDLGYGSYLAGLSFFNAGVGGVHALAYPLGGKFHISHGESNAVMLPYVMSYIRQSCEKRLKDIFVAMNSPSTNLSEVEASFQCIVELKHLVEDIGIPSTLKAFNIAKEDIESLAVDAEKQKRLLARSPLPLSKDDIESIYNLAYSGTIISLE